MESGSPSVKILFTHISAFYGDSYDTGYISYFTYFIVSPAILDFSAVKAIT
ncbi:hypothetical protein bcere0022_9930 [Bacillus cereus Rock3-44]|nr:hypothetical protein bcere0022_9930 [Bacillus cereus Rock3-44]